MRAVPPGAAAARRNGVPALAVIACGALGAQARVAARAAGRPVEVHALPASLHNRPHAIAPAVESLCARLRDEGKDVVVAYADCGTYGALDDVCARLGVERLPGLHCFDVMAGDNEVARLFDEEPGTYLLTDFLVAAFDRLVARPLGIDRRPELAADFFGHYRRAVWLTERPTPVLEAAAERIATSIGLDLQVRPVGSRLTASITRLVASAPRAGASRAGAARSA